MLRAERLLEIIERLQRLSAEKGRRLLLDFLRQGSAARCGLLFLNEEASQHLRLLASSGRLPSRPLPQNDRQQQASTPDLIPLSGLFGSVMRARTPRFIPSIHQEPQALPDECHWSRAAGPLLLCPLGEADQPASGLLVLCFASRHGRQSAAQQGEPALLLTSDLFQLCLTLLARSLSGVLSPVEAVVYEQATESRPHRRRSSAAAVATAPRPQPPPEGAIEEERARLAHILHDGLAQELAHILHQLEVASRWLESQPEEAKRALAEAQQQLQQSLERLRETIATLAPAPLGEVSFELALRSLLEDFKRAEPAITLEERIEQPLTLPRTLESTIFHLVQEALNNVRKHAQAGHVTISIEHQDGALVVSIEDNGKGFAPAPERREGGLQHQLGLYLMRERVQRAGGSLTIQSALRQGTRLEARFPQDRGRADSPLTARERQILQLLSSGASTRVIAQQLALSDEAVKADIQAIKRKLKTRTRIEAIVSALRLHWLE
ncbi:helix-turn-helix transcriptional regulator [Thermogemmatispora onikobensis]|uniref:helix-turn-helix transcriptional regulator n=1 Tax=Thermogemmatispora onikobensis TaxID=732234 RepID=UPI0008529428|nr:ATP-binding protein [Thermogemmatispora onikobensis]